MAEDFSWPFDILTRVVKFVWMEGGVFVCGGQKNQFSEAEWVIHRNEMLKDADRANWKVAFTKQESGHLVDSIRPYCGAYGAVGANPEADPPIRGKPTFIIAGQYYSYDGDPSDMDAQKQIIMTSIGGSEWNETRREGKGFCYAAGYSKKDKKFYVQCVADLEYGSAQFNVVVLASEDGTTWTEADSVAQTGFGNYAHKLLMDTGHPMVKDGVGQVVPNGGYYGWDGGNLIIKPKVLNPYYPSYPGAGATNEIETIERIVDPETGAVTIVTTTKTLPIDQITCVAYADGIWQAGGFMGEGPDPEGAILKIATSTDDGKSWKVEYTAPATQYAFCLMGAPPEMFT